MVVAIVKVIVESKASRSEWISQHAPDFTGETIDHGHCSSLSSHGRRYREARVPLVGR